jgi:hypothetical protein
MKAGMAAGLPWSPRNWAIFEAWAEAAGRGRPLPVREVVIADRNRVISRVPRMAKPRLAP